MVVAWLTFISLKTYISLFEIALKGLYEKRGQNFSNIIFISIDIIQILVQRKEKIVCESLKNILKVTLKHHNYDT